jgi:hypothetical protein
MSPSSRSRHAGLFAVAAFVRALHGLVAQAVGDVAQDSVYIPRCFTGEEGASVPMPPPPAPRPIAQLRPRRTRSYAHSRVPPSISTQ